MIHRNNLTAEVRGSNPLGSTSLPLAARASARWAKDPGGAANK
jgi:hypothetical protein